jgi:hypothetical protein
MTKHWEMRAAAAESLIKHFCEVIAEVIGTNVNERQVFEEVCEIMTIMVMAMPPEYRNSFLQAMSQVWANEIEHDPGLRIASINASKETMQ